MEVKEFFNKLELYCKKIKQHCTKCCFRDFCYCVPANYTDELLENTSRQIAKLDRKPIRQTLTDGIKALPDTPHKTMWYKHYTDLIYKTVTGKTAKQLRDERGAPVKAVASDYMTAAEIESVTALENSVAVLIWQISALQLTICCPLTRHITWRFCESLYHLGG
jgi:hypothetical protein